MTVLVGAPRPGRKPMNAPVMNERIRLPRLSRMSFPGHLKPRTLILLASCVLVRRAYSSRMIYAANMPSMMLMMLKPS